VEPRLLWNPGIHECGHSLASHLYVAYPECGKWGRFTPAHLSSVRSNLEISLYAQALQSGFHTKIERLLIYLIRANCPAHLCHLDVLVSNLGCPDMHMRASDL
jgi:hypothetical protein